MLILDKIDFKTKTVTRDKGLYIMTRISIWDYITVENIYVPNIRVPQYIREMLTTINGEINSNAI